MKDFNKLTDEELRVETAKTLGWTEVCPCTENHWGEPWSGFEGRLRGLPGDVPDFPRDLNACHEFEAALSCPAMFNYMAHLIKLCALDMYKPDCGALFVVAHATARQRCLALLATLEGEPCGT